MIRLIIVVAIGYIFTGCFSEEWKGWIYPDANNLSSSQYIGSFKSIEECRNSAVGRLRSMNRQSSGDYECGLNCRSEYGVNICEKTIR